MPVMKPQSKIQRFHTISGNINSTLSMKFSYPSRTLVTEATVGRTIISRSSSANLRAAALTSRGDFRPILTVLKSIVIVSY